MRLWLLVLAGVCASAGTSLVVWAAVRSESRDYCELLDHGLVRTNADDRQVGDAIHLALESLYPQRRASVDDSEAEIDYRQSADVWFTNPDAFGRVYERTSRLVRERVDAQGRSLKIEVLRGVDMPTLVFIEHETPHLVTRVAQQIAMQLSEMGVVTR